MTVITVSKNDLVRLKKTSKSIVKQKSKDFEWLIIDGNSQDGTVEYVQMDLNHPNIIIRSLKAGGIYNAMNYAASIAAGKYLIFLNAGDTFISPNSIAEILILLEEKSPPIPAIASTVLHLTDQFDVFDVSVPRIEQIGIYQIANINHQGVIMSKDLFQQLHGFDENLKFAADGKLLDQFLAKFGFALTDLVFVGFEIGGTAGRNFRSTILEAKSFRPSTDGAFRSFSLILKNKAKMCFITIARVAVFKRLFSLYVIKFRCRRIPKHIKQTDWILNPSNWF